MARRKPKGVKLRTLKVRNFKALDTLEIEFPQPRMKRDPDVLVLGSENGLGKTSVLEACALLYLLAGTGGELLEFAARAEMPVDLYDLLVRTGAEEARLEACFVIDGAEAKVKAVVPRKGGARVEGQTRPFKELLKRQGFNPRDLADQFLHPLLAIGSDPLLLPSFLYFHSFRKVQEGSPELGMMVDREPVLRRRRYLRRPEYPISAFKLEILRSMMSRADLFEQMTFFGQSDEEAADEVMTVLDDLAQRYAGGTIGKLRPSPDSTIDFRIAPVDGGPSYTFDGLSSGQKEIISTLFLIWRYSQTGGCLVLIDEPELHLNVQWHRDFIQQVHELAPANQYIVATHSEDIFASVDSDRRLLLVPSESAAR